MSARLLSIIGPPAAGKTTLAERLAARLGGQLIREPYDVNPFLADADTGCDDAKLPAQLHFLMSRAGQMARGAWPGRGLVVSDYGFCQDAIFAAEQLEEEDLETYRRVAGRVGPLVKAPDVMIGLRAGSAELLGRIAARGRGYEHVMTAGFLDALNDACQRALDAAACPVIRIDAEREDVLTDAFLEALCEKLTPLLAAAGGERGPNA